MISYKKANKYYEDYLDYANEYGDVELGWHDLPMEHYNALIKHLEETKPSDIRDATLCWFIKDFKETL